MSDISTEGEDEDEDEDEVEDEVSEEGEELILSDRIAIVIATRPLEGRIYYHGARDRT